MMKIWTCGPHIYGVIDGKMRLAQPTLPQANENVLTEEDEAKVKSGICPKCGEKLEIRNI